MKKYLFSLIVLVAPLSVHAASVHVTKHWYNYSYQPDGSGYELIASFQAAFPSTMSPGQPGVVTGATSMMGSANGIRPLGGHECPDGGCTPSGSQFIFSSPGTFTPSGPRGGPTNNGVFTAPTTPGTYKMGFFAFFDRDPAESAVGWCVAPGGGIATCVTPFSYGEDTVTVTGTQCNDGLNNDSAEGADTLDPQCHTDCNVNNPGSYVATHNSETTPPNGTCPAPASLNLNGRAAFLQVVKNFFASITTRAWAGE